MPSSVFLHDGEKQITVRFPTEEDRERFKAHYRALDALGVRYRDERNAAVEMLRRLEWSGTEGADGEPGVCPLCWSVERVGHASDCELAALLAALPGAAGAEEEG